MKALEKALGAVIWRGKSRLDGSPIVVIATGLGRKSENSKTGAMLQTYIIRADVHPVEAVRTGADASICGDCPLRPALAGDGPRCYVNKGHGPQVVYRSFLRGVYPDASPAEVGKLARDRGLPIRLGTYGDPGAVPTEVWRKLVGDSLGRTGYSHQWRKRDSLRTLAMASADSLADAEDAWSQGWRTFRVIRDTSELTANEILCPASKEAGRKTTCANCKLCNGATESDKRKSIAIVDHGPTAPKGPRKPLKTI